MAIFSVFFFILDHSAIPPPRLYCRFLSFLSRCHHGRFLINTRPGYAMSRHAAVRHKTPCFDKYHAQRSSHAYPSYRKYNAITLSVLSYSNFRVYSSTEHILRRYSSGLPLYRFLRLSSYYHRSLSFTCFTAR